MKSSNKRSQYTSRRERKEEESRSHPVRLEVHPLQRDPFCLFHEFVDNPHEGEDGEGDVGGEEGTCERGGGAREGQSVNKGKGGGSREGEGRTGTPGTGKEDAIA